MDHDLRQEVLDVRKVIERSTSKVSLKDLEKKGFRQVKVLRAGDINALIMKAVQNVLAKAPRGGMSDEERQKIMKSARDELNAQITDYERNFALIDTLSARKVEWSAHLAETARAFREVDGLWLERFSTTEGDIDIEQDWGSLPVPEELFMFGKTADRTRVSAIAERLGDGHIRSVVRARIRQKTTYEFDMTVPVAAPGPKP